MVVTVRPAAPAGCRIAPRGWRSGNGRFAGQRLAQDPDPDLHKRAARLRLGKSQRGAIGPELFRRPHHGCERCRDNAFLVIPEVVNGGIDAIEPGAIEVMPLVLETADNTRPVEPGGTV